MRVTETRLPGAFLLEPDVFEDSRGFVIEYFNSQRFRDAGLDLKFVQLNHSRSSKGVLRGLHYQLRQPQGKLIQVTHGAVFDVAVDIRKGSPTFGQWVGEILSEANHRQLYIPEGFAHGFCVLSDSADLLYQCTALYRPDDECGLAWDDPALNIHWPDGPLQLSEKDKGWRSLSDANAALPCYQP